MKTETVQGYTCVVGTDKEENWRLLDESESLYWFFHLSDFPSCYVILQTEEKVEKSIITACAKLCLENTKFRNMRNVYVDYTTIDNVKKGDMVGEVYYKSYKKVKKIKLN